MGKGEVPIQEGCDSLSTLTHAHAHSIFKCPRLLDRFDPPSTVHGADWSFKTTPVFYFDDEFLVN